MPADVKTKYKLNSFPYMGKDDSHPAERTLGEHVVFRLLKPYRKTGRNVTTDNFFSWVNLAKTLRQQEISIVGTVNCIQKQILQEIKKIKEDLYTTKVFKHDGCTLTVYQAKTTKNVLLLSTICQSKSCTSKTRERCSSLFVVNALENKKNSFIVKFAANKYCS